MTDIIIIGAGAAGMTAALYALRSGKTVLLIEAETFGGQIAFSPKVENFPSIKQISGNEFADRLLTQITDLGAEVEMGRVQSIEKVQERHFRVTTEYGVYESGAVIIAAGVKHKHLNAAGEVQLLGHGVYYCAVCDGPFYKNEDVVLIGDANSALQYAMLLSNYCSKVTIVTLFDRFFGDLTLQNAVRAKDNIQIIHNMALQKFEGEKHLSACVFKDTKTGELLTIDTRAVFVAIGQVPDNKPFDSVVDLDAQGFIAANETCSTRTAGVYVAGDCRTKAMRQLTTACSDGAVAAIAAVNYLG